MHDNHHDKQELDDVEASAPAPREDGRASRPARGDTNRSRRRFTQAGLSASVIMTLASRPALANHCTPSGMDSGNVSKPHMVECIGLTPGFWKTHPEEWHAAGFEPGVCNPVTAGHGECKDYDFVTSGELQAAQSAIAHGTFVAYQSWAGWDDSTPPETPPQPAYPPTTLEEVFGSAFANLGASFATPGQTMMQAFWDKSSPSGVSAPQTLISHACAAVLNAGRFGAEAFGFTPEQLIDYIANWNGTLEALKDSLQRLNERS